ncbi:hypothetical protein [Rheinheimera hassiensis]|nr:hypothetical protein [Rheinheimera hassiensis]
MRFLPAIFFVAVGIWVSFSYPDLAAQAFNYIGRAIEWAKEMLGDKV